MDQAQTRNKLRMTRGFCTENLDILHDNHEWDLMRTLCKQIQVKVSRNSSRKDKAALAYTTGVEFVKFLIIHVAKFDSTSETIEDYEQDPDFNKGCSQLHSSLNGELQGPIKLSVTHHTQLLKTQTTLARNILRSLVLTRETQGVFDMIQPIVSTWIVYRLGLMWWGKNSKTISDTSEDEIAERLSVLGVDQAPVKSIFFVTKYKSGNTARILTLQPPPQTLSALQEAVSRKWRKELGGADVRVEVVWCINGGTMEIKGWSCPKPGWTPQDAYLLSLETEDEWKYWFQKGNACADLTGEAYALLNVA